MRSVCESRVLGIAMPPFAPRPVRCPSPSIQQDPEIECSLLIPVVKPLEGARVRASLLLVTRPSGSVSRRGRKQMIIEPILLWTWTLGFLQANAQSRAAPSHRPDDDVWSARCRVTNCDFHQARYWPGLSRIISVRRTVRILTGSAASPPPPRDRQRGRSAGILCVVHAQ